ncbi:hypothetical protein [Sphingomonas sp. TREG-RG-20F-R18-01]|uniref:hypothetical protein n=1 Tax=Sphingomonas sp. TREG-RG-20F-R18-01 TaxID=2914982 RepID=UPI001F571005|nr:hypothetical protein [Sphingomonas sp. TREG-RG-20F-R18-01]
MSGILDILTGWKWKIAVGAGGLVLAAAAFFLLQAQLENRHLTKQVTQLEGRINDRTTGYVAQLAQATTNVKQLSVALDTQNEKLKTQAAQSGAELARLNAQISVIQHDNLRLKANSASLMNHDIKGDTLEQRVGDVDRALLETLK